MRRVIITIIVVMSLISLPASAQKFSKGHVIGFYNLENLFDTYHDEGKSDLQVRTSGYSKFADTKIDAGILTGPESILRASSHITMEIISLF